MFGLKKQVHLAFWFYIFAKGSDSFFTLEVHDQTSSFRDYPCNETFIVTGGRGIVNIKSPGNNDVDTDPQECYCLLHGPSTTPWPEGEEVELQWGSHTTHSDQTTAFTFYQSDILIPYQALPFTMNTSDHSSIYLRKNDTYIVRILEPAAGRYYRFNPPFYADLSCSPHAFYRPGYPITTSSTPHVTSIPTTSADDITTRSSIDDTSTTTTTITTTTTAENHITEQVGSDDKGGDMMLYIIIGAAAGGGMLLIIIIIIIVLLMKRKGASPCCNSASTKDKSQEYAVKFNNNGTDDDSAKQGVNHEYVNVQTEPPPSDTIEYAQVDTSRLAPRQRSQKEKEPQSNDEVALTYADLDFVQNNDTDLVPNEIYESQEHAEAENDTHDQDISEMYAQPMKKSHSRKEADEQKLNDKQEMDMSEMYAKPMIKPKPPKETVDMDISEMYATSTKKPKTTS